MGAILKDLEANFEILNIVTYLQFSLPLSLFYPSLNFFSLDIMVQVSHTSLSSPSDSSRLDMGAGLLARL